MIKYSAGMVQSKALGFSLFQVRTYPLEPHLKKSFLCPGPLACCLVLACPVRNVYGGRGSQGGGTSIASKGEPSYHGNNNTIMLWDMYECSVLQPEDKAL